MTMEHLAFEKVLLVEIRYCCNHENKHCHSKKSNKSTI